MHELCLQKWYEAEPQRGLKCTVCLEPLATSDLTIPEKIPEVSHNDYFMYYRPYCFLSILHMSIFSSMTYSVPPLTFGQVRFIYLFFQTGVHFVYYALAEQLFDVRDKKQYLSLWFQGYRPWFLACHALLLSFYATSFPLVGLIENFYMTFYLQIHCEILEEMNLNKRIRFVNRLKAPQREASSE